MRYVAFILRRARIYVFDYETARSGLFDLAGNYISGLLALDPATVRDLAKS